MKKLDLINELKKEFKEVGSPDEIQDVMKTKTYDVPVFEVSDSGSATKKTVSFYVENEGEATEVAYLREVKINSFSDDVIRMIQTQIAMKTILTGAILEVNDKMKFAIVRAFVKTETGVKEVKFLYNQVGEALEISSF